MSEQSRDNQAGPGAGDADREAADWEPGDPTGREPGDLLVAMSPRQILGGFALLAGLLIMLKRRGRGRRGQGRRSGHDRDLDRG